MVSGNTTQGSGCHSKENQDLRKVEEVVERGHRGNKEDTQARKEKTWTTLGGSGPSGSSAAAINSEIHKPNVE